MPAKKILMFNDKYYELIELCKKIESDGKKADIISQAKKSVDELNKLTNELQSILTVNPTLAKEINTFKENQVKKFETILAK